MTFHNSRQHKITIYTLVALVAMLGLSSCSPRKNNAATRNYQAFITRYNIYYNGDTHYKETLADMERKYEDDYSQPLFLHPIEAKENKQAPQPSGDFTRSIEKAQKAIQLRSIKKKPKRKSGKRDEKYKEWLKREEYNPFLHNAWLMMGRSQYYNGDFLGSASTFFYISKHFKWLPQTVTESQLMQALSYVSMGWQFEAEVILKRIKADELSNAQLRNLYNYTYANFHLHANAYEESIPYLTEAINGASGAQKTRLRFRLGQVYQSLGRNAEAYKAYGAAGGSSSATYRTKFNARIKQSEVYVGDNIEPEVKALRRMTRYDRNKEYLDQVYYAIGNLYLSRGDTTKAIENYELASEKSTRNGIDKAINQVHLGELYFLRGNYEKAQPNYSEAVPLLPETYPDYKLIKRRSDVLDELAVYSQNVNLQDSLLRLAAMTPEERDAVIKKLIEELKEKEKKEAEDAAREEYMAQRNANGNRLQDNTQSFNINTDNSWYFYNTATKNAGKTEFQKRWGSRKLADDWRRRNKATFNTDDFNADNGDETADNQETNIENPDSITEGEGKVELENTNDPHFPEYYLAQIPQTDEEKATSHEVIQEGLYNMGVILKDKLEDFGAARREFDRLLTDYPDNVYRLDAYYNLYLMYIRQGNDAEAEKYRQLILSDFAESKYGLALRDENYIENLRQMDNIQQQMYEDTYAAYLDNRNADVHRLCDEMAEKYPLSKIMPKFMFLNALAYVTDKNPEAFNSTLRDLLDRYPNTDITPIASAWLKGMAQGRELQAGVSNIRGMIWELRLTNDSTAVASDEPANFDLSPDVPQTLVFSFPTDQVAANELLFEVARHNFRSFVVKDFDLEVMNFGRLGLLIVRGFENKEELDHYRSVMAASDDFKLPAGVRPIAISQPNLQILFDQGRSFEEYFRYLEEQNYIDAQADILTPEQIEPLSEAEAAENVFEDVPEELTEPNEAPEEPLDVPVAPSQAEPSAPVETPVETPVTPAPSEPKTPATQPAQRPAKAQNQAPATAQSTTKPSTQKPSTKPAPAPIIPGSEGDDPLFDE